jgi:hypothetical protein
MSRLRSKKDVPQVEVKRYEPTSWDIQAHAVLVELEARKDKHHQKWGCERLITLVDTEFREKFWVQMARVWDATDAKDIQRLRKAVYGMVKGYDALEKWAQDNGKLKMGKSWQLSRPSMKALTYSVNAKTCTRSGHWRSLRLS